MIKSVTRSAYTSSTIQECELVLGTAQLGMEYGRVNAAGKPMRSEAVRMVQYALAHCVTAFDTARGYGDAEAVLGEALAATSGKYPRVVTKLDLACVPNFANGSDVRKAVDESIRSSCRALGVPTLHAVLLHKWAHFRMWDGAAWECLLRHRDAGRIGILGVSVYEPSEALDALYCPDIQLLQIPLNVLDRRWGRVMKESCVRRPDVVVHARSVLLQGILVHSGDRWPLIHGFDNADCVRKFREFVREFGRSGVTDFCLAYVRSLSWIGGVVIGCETLDQLRENLELFQRPKLTNSQIAALEQAFSSVPVELLNPMKWSKETKPKAAYAT
jgi:aryl-alcohol dehydrogenase-like predicted oxidoreductase